MLARRRHALLRKDQLANAGAFVDLDADELGLLAEPVYPPHAAAAVHVHPLAARLEALRDLLLRTAEGLPLLRRNRRPQRRVHGVQHIEDRDGVRAAAAPALRRSDSEPRT